MTKGKTLLTDTKRLHAYLGGVHYEGVRNSKGKKFKGRAALKRGKGREKGSLSLTDPTLRAGHLPELPGTAMRGEAEIFKLYLKNNTEKEKRDTYETAWRNKRVRGVQGLSHLESLCHGIRADYSRSGGKEVARKRFLKEEEGKSGLEEERGGLHI